MTSASLKHEAGHPKLVLWNNPEGPGGEGGGMGVSGCGDVCTPVADSYWCMAKKHQKYCKVISLQLKLFF